MEDVGSGDHSKRVPPVTIPNTEVKPLCADDTWLATTWESRILPDKPQGMKKWHKKFAECHIILGSSMVEQPAVNR